ncbi:hypothetical protein FKM82_013529 [Ascaphus truei]
MAYPGPSWGPFLVSGGLLPPFILGRPAALRAANGPLRVFSCPPPLTNWCYGRPAVSTIHFRYRLWFATSKMAVLPYPVTSIRSPSFSRRTSSGADVSWPSLPAQSAPASGKGLQARQTFGRLHLLGHAFHDLLPGSRPSPSTGFPGKYRGDSAVQVTAVFAIRRGIAGTTRGSPGTDCDLIDRCTERRGVVEPFWE